MKLITVVPHWPFTCSGPSFNTNTIFTDIEGILPKGPYLPSVSIDCLGKVIILFELGLSKAVIYLWLISRWPVWYCARPYLKATNGSGHSRHGNAVAVDNNLGGHPKGRTPGVVFDGDAHCIIFCALSVSNKPLIQHQHHGVDFWGGGGGGGGPHQHPFVRWLMCLNKPLNTLVFQNTENKMDIRLSYLYISNLFTGKRMALCDNKLNLIWWGPQQHPWSGGWGA